MGRDTVQLETAVNTISHEYLLEFTSEYDILKTLHPELPGPEDRIVDFLEGKVGQKAGEEYSPMLHQATGLSQKLEQPLLLGRRESVPDRRGLADECLQRRDAGLEHVLHRGRTGAGYTSYPHPKTTGDATVFNMDLFNLICAPNPTKVKTKSCPRAPHEVPLLTLTATRVIEMDDPAAATDSSGVPSTIERSPLDFAHEAGASDQGTVAPEMPSSEDVPATNILGAGQDEETAATDPPAALESCKRGRDGTDVNAPPNSLRRDHADPRPSGSSHEGKSLAAIQLGLASTVFVPEDAPTGVSGPDPLSFVDPPSRHPRMFPSKSSQGTATGDPKSENASSPVEVGSPKSIYRPEWGVANGSLLDTLEACQDLVDHAAGPEVRAEGKAAEEVCCSSGSPRQKNSSPGAGNKKPRSTTGDRGRYEEGRIRQECWQVATLQEQVSGEEKLKAAFEEFKQYKDDWVEQRCAELDACLDALSIDFDEELYPHMLTAIAGRMWVIGHGLRLAVMKCGKSLEMRQAFTDVMSAGIAKGMSEGLRHGVEHGQAKLNVESIEAYDPEAEAKFVAALQALKDLKYPLVDQLEGLKDAPMDVIKAALYLESDTGEVRDPRNPWAYKEEMLLADAIAANISRAEKKKKCRIVCRTHGIVSAHHARSDGVPVYVPTVVPQGLALLLADAATQTEFDT
nr:hypothetical protein [Tanacetum cinerariifolium]